VLSLVLPTYNESANITGLIDVLDAVLRDIPHEIIVVDDDSPDGTWKVAQSLSKTHPSVRVLRRVGRRGLSSAVIEGFDMAKGTVLAVMDADGQHDSALLLKLLSAIDKGSDLAIGSRYVEGGSVGDWVTDRRIISGLGTMLAHKLSRVRVSDPLGGFFALKKTLYARVRPRLKPAGFKILLEVLAHVPPASRVMEVPLIFRMRLHGASKLSFRVQMEFLWQVVRLSAGRVFSGACAFCGILFWLTAAGAGVFLAVRAWHLKPLVDPAVRTAVQRAMQDTADRHGWLLSDLTLLKVGTGSITLRHRQHLRGLSDPTDCTVTLSPVSSTCAPSAD
jgi:dolichol-phosphate mannosyltransferase